MPSFRVRVLAEAEVDVGAMLAAVPPAAQPVLLDRSDGSGWSLLAWAPDRVVEGRVAAGAGRWPLARQDPARLFPGPAEETWTRDDPEPPLAGGWLGWFGFECGHAYEPFPWVASDPSGFPDFHFGRYRRAVAVDPRGRGRLLWAEPAAGAAAERRRVQEEFRALVAARPAPDPPEGWRLPAPPRPATPAARFQAAVARLRRWIAEGELYQANLSHRLVAPAPADPRSLYLRLRRAQPTAHSGCWLDGSGRALLSWSPESFLRVLGSDVETRPIKGTAPRSGDPRRDALALAALEASAKERAELTMIVDMARNDLGRLAPPGAVEVVSAGSVEAYPTLYHRVATVRARWDPARGLASLLRAAFPPASVTGAPKVRAMQAIAELEQEGRGPYCGAFGGLEPGAPRADFSVLIRTAVVRGGELSFRVGAGVVWDSDPVNEWEETLLKARLLAAAHGAAPEPEAVELEGAQRP